MNEIVYMIFQNIIVCLKELKVYSVHGKSSKKLLLWIIICHNVLKSI